MSTERGNRCGYCLEELCCMVDPKHFPCGHVFCLDCILADYDVKGTLRCCICRRVVQHWLPDLSLLPDFGAKSSPSMSQCDRCPGVAVYYCLDCEHKLCKKHHKRHGAYFEDSHICVDICLYNQRPAYYGRVACKKHLGENLSHACLKCHVLTCARCDPGDLCADKKTHEFKSLARAERELKSEIDELLKDASDRVTKLCQSEKHAWSVVDKLESDSEKMISRVLRRMNKQILALKTSAEDLINEIKDKKAKRVLEASYYVQNLVKERKDLESLQRPIRKLLRTAHVTDLIQQRIEFTKQLGYHTKREMKQLVIQNHVLKPVGRFRSIELILTPEHELLEDIQ